MIKLPKIDCGFRELPALNSEVLKEIELLGEAIGSDLVGDLAVVFLADARTRVVELRCAIMDHDASRIAESAHNLSGASATLGATGLARLCAALEMSSGDLPLPLSFQFLEAIERELERVEAAFVSRASIAH
jgi:HPt (histidine-containing phosphotransfer) domain-containing protein